MLCNRSVFSLDPQNYRPFPNLSTFYGAKYSLYNSMLTCSEATKTTGHFPICQAFMVQNIYLFFILTRTQRIYYYSIVWGIVYNRSMRHRGTLRPLNKLALPQSPLQATLLTFYIYRKINNYTIAF